MSTAPVGRLKPPPGGEGVLGPLRLGGNGAPLRPPVLVGVGGVPAKRVFMPAQRKQRCYP